RWMQWAAFRIALGQQIRAVLAEDLIECLRVQDVAVNWIVQTGIGQEVMDSARKSLRPKTPMHKPLLVPHSSERPRCYLHENYTDVRSAERAEAGLGSGLVIGITRIERRSRPPTGFLVTDIGRSGENQRGVKIGLVEHINADPSVEVATIADKT